MMALPLMEMRRVFPDQWAPLCYWELGQAILKQSLEQGKQGKAFASVNPAYAQISAPHEPILFEAPLLRVDESEVWPPFKEFLRHYVNPFLCAKFQGRGFGEVLEDFPLGVCNELLYDRSPLVSWLRPNFIPLVAVPHFLERYRKVRSQNISRLQQEWMRATLIRYLLGVLNRVRPVVSKKAKLCARLGKFLPEDKLNSVQWIFGACGSKPLTIPEQVPQGSFWVTRDDAQANAVWECAKSRQISLMVLRMDYGFWDRFLPSSPRAPALCLVWNSKEDLGLWRAVLETGIPNLVLDWRGVPFQWKARLPGSWKLVRSQVCSRQRSLLWLQKR